MDISIWLKSLGLDQYVAAFDANAIDSEILPKLTAEDLKEVGVAALAHRKRLLEAISALNQVERHEPVPAKQPASSSRPDSNKTLRGVEPDRPREAERRQLTV